MGKPAFAVVMVSALLVAMNPQWMHDYLKANRNAVQHAFTDQGVVLTAPTKELQSFLARHCGTKAAWHELVELARVPDR